jgi:hypothetical protein
MHCVIYLHYVISALCNPHSDRSTLECAIFHWLYIQASERHTTIAIYRQKHTWVRPEHSQCYYTITFFYFAKFDALKSFIDLFTPVCSVVDAEINAVEMSLYGNKSGSGGRGQTDFSALWCKSSTRFWRERNFLVRQISAPSATVKYKIYEI